MATPPEIAPLLQGLLESVDDMHATWRRKAAGHGGPLPEPARLLRAARDLYMQDRFAEAREVAMLALHKDLKTAPVYRVIAASSHMLKDYQLASTCYLVAFHQEPRHTGTLLNLGKCLIELRQFEQARHVLGNFIKLSKESEAFAERVAEARNLLGQITRLSAAASSKD